MACFIHQDACDRGLDADDFVEDMKKTLANISLYELSKLKHQQKLLLKEINAVPSSPLPTSVSGKPPSDKVDATDAILIRDRSNYHTPFLLPYDIYNRNLYNYLIDSGASSNVMTKKVMEQLNLRVSRPYHNICSMDSKRIEVCGIIKDLQVFLAAYTDRIMTMDIVVIDVPDSWGMLLSRKWASDLGGSLQMDLSYATIPMPDNTFVRLDRELEKRYHVEDPRRPNNEIIYRSCQTGSDAVLTNFFPPLTEHIQNEEIRHSSKRLSTSNFPSKHFQDKAVGLAINASSSPSRLTKKKRKKI